MAWYAASVIMFTRFKDGKQDSYPVYENIILIEAMDENEAFEKSKCRGKADEGDFEGTYCYENRPAELVFFGVRKIIACEDSDRQPADGTEVSYSEFLVSSNDALEKLIIGDSVEITYES